MQGRKKQGDITAVLLHEASEIWADNWCIPATAPHPVAAHAWINWLLTPSHGGDRDGVPQLRDPDPEALSAAAEPSLSNDPLFNVPKSYTDNYQYILNVSPQVVQERTKIYTQFRAG